MVFDSSNESHTRDENEEDTAADYSANYGYAADIVDELGIDGHSN